jgi:Recombination endonuclease VII
MVTINSLPCEGCGEIITAPRRNQRFCSPECCRKTWIRVNPERYQAAQVRHNEQRRRTPTYERACEWCGKTFVASRSDKRACSRACKNKYWSRQIKRYRRHGCDWDEEFSKLWQAQDGRCYLCGDPLDSDQAACHVDHDHSCCPQGRSCERCRRGLAHPRCNWIVGYAEDDPDRLHRIANNLEKANILVRQRLAARD